MADYKIFFTPARLAYSHSEVSEKINNFLGLSKLHFTADMILWHFSGGDDAKKEQYGKFQPRHQLQHFH